MTAPAINIHYPDWVAGHVDWDRCYTSDAEKMHLVIDLSLQNVVRGSGGPFGAAVFEQETGRLVAVGMNLVVPLNNCMLHAERIGFDEGPVSPASHEYLAERGIQIHHEVLRPDACAVLDLYANRSGRIYNGLALKIPVAV